MSVAKEAELSLIKSCLLELYFSNIMEQALHFVFVFPEAANLVRPNSIANTNSIAKAMNSQLQNRQILLQTAKFNSNIHKMLLM